MKQIDYGKLLETKWSKQFNEKQLETIREGLTKNLDVSHYARPEFTRGQMWQIQQGLEEDLT